MTGWQVQDGYLVTIQPVGTDEARKDALARWSRLPQYIDTEIANLREGLKARLHRAQAATSASSSTRCDSADRDAAGGFAVRLAGGARQDAGVPASSSTRWCASRSSPAFTRYRDFLAEGISAGGARGDRRVGQPERRRLLRRVGARITARCRCRRRRSTTLGLQQIERLDAEMKAIGERSFGTSDVPALLQRAADRSSSTCSRAARS